MKKDSLYYQIKDKKEEINELVKKYKTINSMEPSHEVTLLKIDWMGDYLECYMDLAYLQDKYLQEKSKKIMKMQLEINKLEKTVCELSQENDDLKKELKLQKIKI